MIAKKLLNNIQKRGVYTINQNEYVGQTPVSIVNNTISLETNFINKVNSIDNLQRDITNNTNSINTINTTLNGIPQQLQTITNNVSTNTTNITNNTQQIEVVKTKAETNESNIATINTTLPNKLDTATYNQEKTNFAKTNEANTFVGKNTFKNTGDIVSIQRTDNQSFGIDFKKENGDRVAFVGTSSSEVDKATVWGVSGLKLQTTNSQIDINSGTAPLLYNSSNNSKDRREVLVRNDLYYIRKVNANSFTINANSTQTAEYTISGITRQTLHEFYVVLTTSSVDIGFDMKIYVNNPNYPNMSDIRTISTSNWTNQNLDQNGLVQIGIVVYGNNKIRFRMKNLHNANITFNSFRVYHRLPGGTANS